jgi:hypothetical protein
MPVRKDSLSYLFLGEAFSRFADNAAVPETNIGISLHTADPGDSGTMATNECAYGGCARVNVPRSTSGWKMGSSISPDVSGIIYPASFIQFGPSTTVESITHFSVGESIGGACRILFSGTVTPPIVTGVPRGLSPRLVQTTNISLA